MLAQYTPVISYNFSYVFIATQLTYVAIQMLASALCYCDFLVLSPTLQ